MDHADHASKNAKNCKEKTKKRKEKLPIRRYHAIARFVWFRLVNLLEGF